MKTIILNSITLKSVILKSAILNVLYNLASVKQKATLLVNANTYMIALALCGSNFAMAQMQSLAESDLRQAQGQGGADVEFNLRWNLNTPASKDANNSANYQYNCVNTGNEWCRLGITANNRYSPVTGTKEWIVFKQIQGAIEIPKMTIDGAPIQYTSNGANVNTMAFQIGFNADAPIRIRNLGFQSLNLQADSAAESNSANIPGYLSAPTTYVAGSSFGSSDGSVAGSFDNGKEIGFIGLNISADIAVQGTVKVYACPSGVC